MSILDHSFPSGRFAVVDIETTGLSAAMDRIVEISIFHVDGPGQVRQVLNTLVNPRRRVAGTEIHGITDEDVRRAPTFEDIAPLVASLLSGRVMAAHNVYFDIRFVSNELQLCGFPGQFPHVCTMYLPPMLGTGAKLSLDDACSELGIGRKNAHCAADDALACSEILTRQLALSASLGVTSYRELAKRKKYKFADSFILSPLTAVSPARSPTLLARSPHQPSAALSADDLARAEHRLWMRRYYDALVTAISDLELSDAEAEQLQSIAYAGGLRPSELRAAHARVFAAFINQYLDDEVIDKEERQVLASVWASLRRLGWAPGE